MGGRGQVYPAIGFDVFWSLFDPGTDCIEDIAVLDDVVEVIVAGYNTGEPSIICPETVSVGCFLPFIFLFVVSEDFVAADFGYVVFYQFFKFVAVVESVCVASYNRGSPLTCNLKKLFYQNRGCNYDFGVLNEQKPLFCSFPASFHRQGCPGETVRDSISQLIFSRPRL